MEKSQRKNLGRRKQVKTPVAYQKHVFAKRKFSRKFKGDECSTIIHKECYPNSFLYIYILLSYFTLS